LQLQGQALTVPALISDPASPGSGAVENGTGATSAILTVDNAADCAFGGILRNGGAASLSLVKSNLGTLTLSGNNLLTGGVTISDGVLQLGSPGALNAASPNVVNFGFGAAPTLRLGGNSVTIPMSGLAAASSNAMIENASSTPATLSVTKTTTAVDVFTGTFRDGAGGGGAALGLALSMPASSTVVLAGTNTHTGMTTVNGGNLQIGPGNLKSPVTLASANLVFDPSDGAFGQAVYGVGKVLKNGTGTLTLGAVSSYSGGTDINAAGTLAAAVPGALGTGPITFKVNDATLSVATGSSVAGFAGGWTLNGGPTISADNRTLTVTEAVNGQARSAFFDTKVAINAFTASFVYQETSTASPADGVAFVLQNQGLTALGGGGGGLGYQGITPSAALAINIYNGHVVGTNLFANGDVQGGAYSATGSVNVASGHRIQVDVAYDGSTVIEKLSDLDLPGATWSSSFTGINLAQILGENQAYIGFTGGTGGANALQTISDFSYSLPWAAVDANNVVVNNGLTATIAVLSSPLRPAVTMGTLTMGTGTTLNVQADPATQADIPFGLTLGATSLAGATTTFNVSNNGAGSGTLTLGAVTEVGGSGRSILKNGPGSLLFTGAVHKGTSTITDGAVGISGGALPATGLVIFSGAAADQYPVLASNGVLTRSLGASGAVVQWAAGSNGGFAAWGGPLTVRLNNGAASLNWGSTANFVSNGSSLVLGSYSADNVVDFQNGLNLGSLDRTVTVLKNPASTTDSATISGQIAGAAGLVKAGAGILTLGAANTYQGGTTINGGVLAISTDSNLGAAGTGMTINGGGTLRITSTTFTSARPVALDGAAAVDVADPAGTAILTTSLSGFSGALAKTGPGTLVLTGASTYAGDTSVNGGKLQVDGSLDFQFSTVSVNNGGTLGGTGTINRPVTLTGGGALSSSGALALAGTLDVTGTGNVLSAGAIVVNGTTTIGGGLNVAGSADLDTTMLTVTGPLAAPAGGVTVRQQYQSLAGNLLITPSASDKPVLLAGTDLSSAPAKVTLQGGAVAVNFTVPPTLPPGFRDLSASAIDVKQPTVLTLNFTGTSAADLGDLGLSAGADLSLDPAGMPPSFIKIAATGTAQIEGNPLSLRNGEVNVVPSASVLTIASDIQGSSPLTKTGAGSLVLIGVDSYTGGTSVLAGTLEVGTANSLPVGGALTIGAGGAMVAESGLAAATASGLPNAAAANVAPATPVPEPGTISMLAAGAIAGLALCLRRRMNKANAGRKR
jgi:fibronectin-binding autotransporter adhesin